MKQFDYNSKEFNKLLDEYFQTNEFKKWTDAWFPDVKEESEWRIVTDNKLRPAYYKQNNHDLWYYFAQGLLTKSEYVGFIKGNIFKYVTRYQNKNGVEDLQKAKTYLEELIKFETAKKNYFSNGKTN